MRRTLFAALAVFAAAPAHAAGVSIAMDEVRSITFPKTVSTIYVGNPAIADINLIDSRHAFVLGKGFGNTNVLALDKDGKQVSNIPIMVIGQDTVITLNKGAAHITYACTARHCENAPQQGDERTKFDADMGELTSHQGAAKTNAAAGSVASN